MIGCGTASVSAPPAGGRQQPAAKFGQEPVRAGRDAGLVDQPGEGSRQIH
jgi:hypothetical protein